MTINKERQKAFELYNKFRKENGVMAANGYAKKQAILCVEEITELLCNLELLEELKYWEKVQQELKKI